MYLIRLLIVGETGVGKTSLLVRFNENHFIVDQKTTIGVDYKAKEITIDKESVKLQIWDTAGQERFRSMTSAFYNKAQGVVITFDVTQRDSFTTLQNWIRDVKTSAPENCSIILCANKVDIDPDMWKVKREEYETFAADMNTSIFECSASSGYNVQELFTQLGRDVLRNNKGKLTEVEEADQQGRNGHSIILADFADREKRKKQQSKSNCCG